ncbi:MAG TPA: YciI family protein [Bacillus sp. (in: firmicutes)]|nr:YciI family protein [Bacillus sp. (in: firmicutes)]
MKKFVVLLKNKKPHQLTAQLLNKHVDHLRTLDKMGKLFLCGPFEDNSAAIQIIVAENYEEAKQWVEKDPFVEEKYYQTYELNELIEANEQNNWLLDIPQTKGNLS